MKVIPSFFQTDIWGKFKTDFGWRSFRYDNLLGLQKKIFFNKTMLYFPEIPFSEGSIATIRKIIRDNVYKKHIFTRFEFLSPWENTVAATIMKTGLIKSFEEVQPEYRQWVMIEGGEKHILGQMKPKGRYNIALAKRHKLKIKSGINEKLLKDFYDLYMETARRSNFSGRGARYFQGLVSMLDKSKVGEIMVVYQGKRPLSAGIFLYYGEMASYLYGASGGDRKQMAPYLMHWEAIKRAKENGCKIYDMLAIASPEHPNRHPHAGLTRFKTQFGGQSVHLLGSWDLVGSSFWYTIYRFAQKRRRKITR